MAINRAQLWNQCSFGYFIAFFAWLCVGWISAVSVLVLWISLCHWRAVYLDHLADFDKRNLITLFWLTLVVFSSLIVTISSVIVFVVCK